MERAISQSRAQWNYSVLLLALLAGLVLQGLTLPCICADGTFKMHAALFVDALVFVRYLVARASHETGKGWIFYSLLPLLIIPVVELVVHTCSELPL